MIRTCPQLALGCCVFATLMKSLQQDILSSRAAKPHCMLQQFKLSYSFFLIFNIFPHFLLLCFISLVMVSTLGISAVSLHSSFPIELHVPVYHQCPLTSARFVPAVLWSFVDTLWQIAVLQCIVYLFFLCIIELAYLATVGDPIISGIVLHIIPTHVIM